MSTYVDIRNIGPITKASFVLNKVNLFIGPQSSGKSTVAKIVSFCLWLEKDVIMHLGKDHIDAQFMKEQLVLFHDMESYFKVSSYIYFHSDMIEFTYHSYEDFELRIVGDLQQGLMSKEAYIPSERNIIGISNISSLSLEDNYIRSFIFDWLSLRDKYQRGHEVPILDLGVRYVYNKVRGDTISLADGTEIDLAQSSSGIQALVPMLVYINYVTQWIYEHKLDTSFDKQEVINRAITQFVAEPHEGKVVKATELLSHISNPHSSKMVIEEGEMNIFPATQYELVKAIISMMDFSRGDTLLMTTHSPYIMTSINNLIQGGNAIRDGKPNEVVDDVIPKRCRLNYEDVSAWAISNGGIESINDDEFRLISADALDAASNLISNDFSQLI